MPRFLEHHKRPCLACAHGHHMFTNPPHLPRRVTPLEPRTAWPGMGYTPWQPCTAPRGHGGARRRARTTPRFLEHHRRPCLACAHGHHMFTNHPHLPRIVTPHEPRTAWPGMGYAPWHPCTAPRWHGGARRRARTTPRFLEHHRRPCLACARGHHMFTNHPHLPRRVTPHEPRTAWPGMATGAHHASFSRTSQAPMSRLCREHFSLLISPFSFLLSSSSSSSI